jgi:glycosyltransferase involved in cell wall biosynthesis
MVALKPLVTIGIPTYNRAGLLDRAIKSVLCQDYFPLEIVISDNASTDGTKDLCVYYAERDKRVRYLPSRSNVGATANFSNALKVARGEYFMWLGDDDWIDDLYISECMDVLLNESDVSLVYGCTKYYRMGIADHDGKVFQLLQRSWILRVILYYSRVSDNGMFYGLMRTSQLRGVSMRNVMGGDWHLIANIVSHGYVKVCPTVVVHRELGGATSSYKHIVRALGLPWIQALFPMGAIAIGAFNSILHLGESYKKLSILERLVAASAVFVIVGTKGLRGRLGRVWRALRYYFYLLERK